MSSIFFPIWFSVESTRASECCGLNSVGMLAQMTSDWVCYCHDRDDDDGLCQGKELHMASNIYTLLSRWLYTPALIMT